MKTPLSSTVQFLTLLIFLSPSLSQNPNNLQLFLEPSSRNHHHHHGHPHLQHIGHQPHHRQYHRFCDSFPSRYPPTICIPLYNLHRHPPPPPPSEYDIDPRYGVQKRLVPGGPNPLHN
ncbi:hypothetical protein Dimus_014848 [Dionaea muscipula]